MPQCSLVSCHSVPAVGAALRRLTTPSALHPHHRRGAGAARGSGNRLGGRLGSAAAPAVGVSRPRGCRGAAKTTLASATIAAATAGCWTSCRRQAGIQQAQASRRGAREGRRRRGARLSSSHAIALALLGGRLAVKRCVRSCLGRCDGGQIFPDPCGSLGGRTNMKWEMVHDGGKPITLTFFRNFGTEKCNLHFPKIT